MVGRTLDRYRLLDQVGQGGMAVVYRAMDVPLNREVAVKVLHPHLASQPESRARLQREAQAVAKLRHDNVLEIYAYSGIDSADSYLVTEFIHGPTLRTFIADRALPFPEIGAMIASEIARALGCAHDLGIIHRDIKPENVMIRGDGTVVLCDFGIAQVVDKERMTATGQLLGSPAYMAPEHVDGRPLDCRTDVFSLGVVLYQLVCGELPFRGRNPHETLKRISDGRFTSPEELCPLCGPRLSRVIGRALSRDPADRYAQAQDLREDLLQVLAESGIDDPRAELRAYFADPDGWSRDFAPRLVRAHIQAGTRHRAEGRVAAALALWGRAQQVDPGNDEVKALIRGATRRDRQRRATAAGLALLLCGGLVTMAVRRHHPAPAKHAPDGQAWRAPRPAPPAVAVVQPPPPPAPAPEPPPPVLPDRPPAPVATVRRPHHVRRPPKPPTTAPAPVRTRVVRLSPWPKAVRVSLNGTVLGDYGSDVQDVQLRDGPNELVFENPSCYAERVAIGADADPGEVRVRLRWKPALLKVRLAPPGPADADVVVDGRDYHDIVGRSGQVLALPMRTDNGRATVDVKISAPGYQTVTRAVEVRANQLTPVEVSLSSL